jgi:hypothetical protein
MVQINSKETNLIEVSARKRTNITGQLFLSMVYDES